MKKRKRKTPEQLALAARITAMRKAAGLTKERFAAALDTTLGSVNNWENGQKPSAIWQRELDRFEAKLKEVTA